MPDVTLGQSWPVGTKVHAQVRTGDFYSAGRSVKSATVQKDGSVSFDGLPEGRYWAVGEVDGANVVVQFTSKPVPSSRVRTAAPTSADLQRTPVADPGVEIVTGAKGTKVAGRLVEVPVPRGIEPNPHVNQASVPGNVPQRSSTELGQGTPTDPSEPQPKPRQDRVKKGVWQRSSTETGEATPIGSAEPRGTASNPDSREQAAGERPTDSKPSKKNVRPKAAGKVKK